MGRQPFTLTHHAHLQMQERSITVRDVATVLATYDERTSDDAGNPIFCATVGRRRVAAVIKRGVAPPRVITVYVVNEPD